MTTRIRALLACAAISGMALVVLPQPATAASASDELSASALARQKGDRVRVEGLTTDKSVTYANPDGSFTLEQNAAPVRVKRGGGWADIDTTLQRRTDGTIAPTVSPVELTFSGGGSGPFVSIAEGSKRFVWDWKGDLPTPALDGNTATYAEVLPGVDLTVSAHPQGFSHLLVVKNREAAMNPALEQIAFDTSLSRGLSARRDAHGNMHVVDETGTQHFQSGTPRMWDSGSGVQTFSLDSGSSGEPGRQAAVGIQVNGSSVVVEPDLELLQGQSTVYPVRIDPWFGSNRTNWTSMWKKFPDTTYWNADKINWDDDANGVARSGYESQDGNTVRSIFSMNLSQVSGKKIHSATFQILQTHNWSCSATPVELWATTGISPGTTWNSQPSWLRHLGTAYTSHGNSSCGNQDANVEFDVTGEIQLMSNLGITENSLGLKAPNESDTSQWKRFRNNPTIAINYNSAPDQPTNLTVDGKAGTEPRPVVGSSTPTLAARVSDPDSGDGLQGIFELEKQGAGNTWSSLGSLTKANVSSGDIASVKIGDAGPDLGYGYAGDFDGDGNKDLAAFDTATGDQLWVVRNESVPGYSKIGRTQLVSGGWRNVSKIQVADFDGDGKDDLLGVESGHDLRVWLSTSANGKFSVANHHSFGSGYQNFGKFLPLADFDGDGKKDLAMLEVSQANDMWINRNTSTPGNPSFSGPVNVGQGWSYINYVTAFDVDGDGKADFFGRAIDGQLATWRSTSTASAFTYATWQVFGGGYQNFGTFLLPADFDGDGKKDVGMLEISQADDLWIIRNASSAGNPSIQLHHVGAGWRSVAHLAAADFDTDGKADLLGRRNGELSVWRGTSTATAPSFAGALGFGANWSGFALEHAAIYRVRAFAKDGWAESPRSPWLEFEVNVAPPSAPVVTSTDYGPDPEQFYGAIGQPGNFTFDPNGSPNVVGFKWGWNEQQLTSVPAQSGSPLTISLTPPPPDPESPTRGGRLVLYVKSYDTAGTESQTSTYVFNVGDAL